MSARSGFRLRAVRPVTDTLPDTFSDKAFAWNEDLHPRDSHGRFIRTWSELVEAFQVAWEAYEDNGLLREPPRLADDSTKAEREHFRTERERVEVELSDAETALFNWLVADKDLAVPLPRQLAKTFGGARWAQQGATHLDALEAPTGAYADVGGGPWHRAFLAYSADNVRAEINNALREEREPNVWRVVETMDEAFEAAPPTTEHLVSIRGLSMAQPPDVGDVIVDLGFSSTIGDRNEAEHFAIGRSAGAGRYAKDMDSPPTGNPPVLMEILIPAGSKVITDGWETITPRGSMFEIVGRRGDGTVVALLRPPGTMQQEMAA